MLPPFPATEHSDQPARPGSDAAWPHGTSVYLPSAVPCASADSRVFPHGAGYARPHPGTDTAAPPPTGAKGE